MPFEKGKATPGAGRPGYEIEQAQLEKMRRILDKDLKMMEQLQDAEVLDPVQEKKLAILEGRIKKYADKLHVSKTSTDITSKGEAIVITPEKLKLAEEFEKKLNQQEDELGKGEHAGVDTQPGNKD